MELRAAVAQYSRPLRWTWLRYKHMHHHYQQCARWGIVLTVSQLLSGCGWRFNYYSCLTSVGYFEGNHNRARPGNLDARVWRVTDTDLGDLADTFNTMASTTQAQRVALRDRDIPGAGLPVEHRS